MDEGYLAEMTYFAGNFAPRSWNTCAGQLLSINSNQSLFSLLGTTYGGDGRTTFALPDLRGRLAIGAGQGSGLSNYNLGSRGGSERVTLNQLQIPNHTHTVISKGLYLTSTPHDQKEATGHAYARDEANQFTNVSAAGEDMGSGSVAMTVAATGSGQGHENMIPFCTLTPIICVQGIFPSRS